MRAKPPRFAKRQTIEQAIARTRREVENPWREWGATKYSDFVRYSGNGTGFGESVLRLQAERRLEILKGL